MWVPRVDVYRRSSSWLVKCDIAGIKTEDLSISTRGPQLTISGVRCDPLADDGWIHHSMEIPYSRFACLVTLPRDLEQAAVETQYVDGMLIIQVRFDEDDQ
jgi:HSP20 family protein